MIEKKIDQSSSRRLEGIPPTCDSLTRGRVSNSNNKIVNKYFIPGIFAPRLSLATDEKFDGSGSDCNSVVPKKRRRKNVLGEEDDNAVMMYGDNEGEGDDEDEGEDEDEDRDDDFSSSSRSSSLLQFETLERNCATNCRDSPSSYSFDSLDFSNRKSNGNFGNTSPDSLEGRIFVDNEDRVTTNGSLSLGRDVRLRQANGIVKIRPYRSFESLETCQRLEDATHLSNGGFSTLNGTTENMLNHTSSRGMADYYSDEYDDYDDDIDVGGRTNLTRDKDFWQRFNNGDDTGSKDFEDGINFGEVTTNSSMDGRNIIDLREIGIETKRDAVLDLRSGQTFVSSVALMQSRINIASSMGRGGGGGSCGGQQGWSEQGFNFRFTDKSQSAPSLATDVSRHGVSKNRCSLSPSQLHFEAQDFENFVQVSSVPVGLNLCGLASNDEFRGAEDPDDNDNEMPDTSDEETSRDKDRPFTSTVRTQDRTETNLVLVPVPMSDQDVDSLVDEALRKFKREVEEAADDAAAAQYKPKLQRPYRRAKNNASYELAQQYEIADDDIPPRMASFEEVEDEAPQPTPRRRIRNNASYELAQQFDYVRSVAGQRPFQRMDACDELEEPGTSGLKVTDLVEEMTKNLATGSATDLTTPNGFGPADSRVYSKSSENVNYEKSGRNGGVSDNRIHETESVLSQIKKNLDSFSTYGESASGHDIDDLEKPYFENKPVVPDPDPDPDHHQCNKVENNEVKVLGADKKVGLKVNVNCGDLFAGTSSSSRSVSSTPNLHKISFIGEFYPQEESSHVQSSRDVRGSEDDDPFIDDVDEGIGSVKDYDRLFLHGSVRSESAIGSGSGIKETGRGEQVASKTWNNSSTSSRNTERRSRAGSSTTSGNTSLGEGSTSTASEWPQRPEADNVYPPLSGAESLQRITSLKRSGTVEAKQTESNTSLVPHQHQHQHCDMSSSNVVKITPEKKKGLGGFLQRFSRLRFSGRSKVPRSELLKKSEARSNNGNKVVNKSVQHDKQDKEPDYVIIPLHGPVDEPRTDHLAIVEPSAKDTNGKSAEVQRSGSNLR